VFEYDKLCSQTLVHKLARNRYPGSRADILVDTIVYTKELHSLLGSQDSLAFRKQTFKIKYSFLEQIISIGPGP
jgi:hypothetical protein